MEFRGQLPESAWLARVRVSVPGILIESLPAARDTVMGVYGVLPALLNPNSAGPAIREGQRHLTQWQLQSIAQAIAAEASDKMGGDVSIDTLQPLQAYDAGGRARALSGIVQGLALAKEAGLSDEQVTAALKFAGVDSEQ